MNLLIDGSAQRIFYHLCAAMFIIASHGYFLALAARLLGDRGPEFDGRLTLNPVAHVEPIGTTMLILTQFGWVRPVVLDSDALKGGRLGHFVIPLAALSATLGVAWLLWYSRPLAFHLLTGNSFGVTVIGLIETIARMSVSFAVLNALPVLPLSLGHGLVGVLPALAKKLLNNVFGSALAFSVLIILWLGAALRAPSQFLAQALFDL